MDALKAIVTSEARARVLTSLFGESGRRFYQGELTRVTGLPKLAVQRELRRLVDAGLVRHEVVAGRRLYRADPAASVYEEISSLVRKLRGPQSVIRSALAVRKGIRLAFVFGSFARGEQTAASDIDLMVLTEDSPRVIRTALANAERDLSRSVNENVLTVGEWVSRVRSHDPFIAEILRGPKLWAVGDDEALTSLEPRGRMP